MIATLTLKGQITIPKKIRDALELQPGCKINFAVNDSGDVLLQKVDVHQKAVARKTSGPSSYEDRFEKVRGCADIKVRAFY
jgi:AbrB family looped-hinge helix DNA binding protein